MTYVSSQRVELLSFGYVRKTHKQNIPYVLTKLIELFYDVYFRWKIRGSEMNKFLQIKNTKSMYCKQKLSIKNILFKFSLCPNGWNQDEIGKCLFFIETEYIPANIEYIVIYIEIIEERTATIIKRIRKLRNLKDTTGWGTQRKNILLLDTFKQFKSAIFSALIDIKHIKYKERNPKIKTTHFITPIKMKKQLTFVWDTLLICKHIWSPNFDENNWCVEYSNFNQNIIERPRQLNISLNCLCLPFGINRIRVKLTATSNDITFINEQYATITYRRGGDYATIQNHGFNQTIKPSIPLSISLTLKLEIIAVYADYNTLIPQEKWSKYGIQ